MKTPAIQLRNLKTGITLTALALMLSITTNAKAIDNGDKVKTPPVEIKYLGSVEYKPIFKIEFENQDQDEFYLTLKNENGDIFYSETVKDKKYAKRFQIDDADATGVRVTVTLRSKKANLTQVFEINRNVRQVEDVVIEKVQ